MRVAASLLPAALLVLTLLPSGLASAKVDFREVAPAPGREVIPYGIAAEKSAALRSVEAALSSARLRDWTDADKQLRSAMGGRLFLVVKKTESKSYRINADNFRASARELVRQYRERAIRLAGQGRREDAAQALRLLEEFCQAVAFATDYKDDPAFCDPEYFHAAASHWLSIVKTRDALGIPHPGSTSRAVVVLKNRILPQLDEIWRSEVKQAEKDNTPAAFEAALALSVARERMVLLKEVPEWGKMARWPVPAFVMATSNTACPCRK